MQNDIENALSEVACITGRHFYVVERVFHLLMGAHGYGHILIVRDGTLTGVAMPDNLGPLPSSLCAEIETSYDDVVQLRDPIMRALRRMEGPAGWT
jgi:hypothetical protein